MTAPLSTREQFILDLIRSYRAEHGYAPSMREIGNAIGVKSTSLVSWYINKLVAAGKIKRDVMVARSIVIVEGKEGEG